MQDSNSIDKSMRGGYCPTYIEPYLIKFYCELKSNGFAYRSIRAYMRSATHFGAWLQKNKIPLEDIDSHTIKRFSVHRCQCKNQWQTKKGFDQKYVKRVYYFVEYLSKNNIIFYKSKNNKKSLPVLVEDYIDNSIKMGLSPKTLDHYKIAIIEILSIIGNNPKTYNAKNINGVICLLAKQKGTVYVRNRAKALRSYLRFLSVKELVPPELILAVPKHAQWANSSIPKYFNRTDIDRIMRSINIDTPAGIRNRAIILLMARLGLRAGDIVNLQCKQINWTDGTLLVSGKGKREDELPLSQDVGDALLIYLNEVRQNVDLKQVFLCLNAPYRSLASSVSVSALARRIIIQAGIKNPPSFGAHTFRHTAATELLRSGATLEVVSSILRHRRLDMTGYYAKVDIPMLTSIVQPWPEYLSC